MSDTTDPRWGYGDDGLRERGWTVEERDAFIREMRTEHDANWSHTDGRMQSVWIDGVGAHLTFGDRPDDRSRVWVTYLDRSANRIAGPRWVNGGPDEWARVVLFGRR